MRDCHICTAPLYEFDHGGRLWLIEFPPTGGPCPIKANGMPYQRIPRGFDEALAAFRAERSLDVSGDS
jgi:hypothetical protein